MTNVVIEPAPSHLIKVTNDYGVEHAFSQGYLKDCPKFQSYFNSTTYHTCECDILLRHDWCYIPGNPERQTQTPDGKIYLNSSFHDHRACSGRKCKYEDLQKLINKLINNVVKDADEARWFFDAVRYVLPNFDTETQSTIENFIQHKIKQESAIDPIRSVESNWFNCCGVCNSGIIFHPTVEATQHYDKAVWQWKDCPWDIFVCI